VGNFFLYINNDQNLHSTYMLHLGQSATGLYLSLATEGRPLRCICYRLYLYTLASVAVCILFLLLCLSRYLCRVWRYAFFFFVGFFLCPDADVVVMCWSTGL
jgi:hypothetical protein